MKNLFLKKILLLIIMLISFSSFACDCDCEGDCSFNVISNRNGLVAIVKVVEYSDFLDYEIDGYDKKMPFSMTVEIIKKYKGTESKKRIKIWGDNGNLCRPYLSYFKVGKYYLIAPSRIENNSNAGMKGGYDFFVCNTDYLTVDYEKGIAFGEYSKKKTEISLKDFERDLRK